MNPEVGLLSYNQRDGSQQFYKPYSEETGQLIDKEARSIVEGQYERVKALLTEKSALMNELADRLTDKETLVYSDLREVLGERPFGVQENVASFVTAGGNPFTAEFDGDAKSSADAKEAGGEDQISGQ